MNFTNFKKKNILVAGGTGLVGTNLTKRLNALGANVLSTFFSRKPAVFKENYKHFDFTKFQDCIEATRGIDYVFICAAQTFGAKLIKENLSAFILPNLNIYAGLLEACSRNKVERVIFISSSTVYQEANYPICEAELDLNKPPYELYFGVGWLSRYIEQLTKLYYKNNLKVGIVRPTNIYGPHDNFDEEKSHVIPALIKRALRKEDPFCVWGDGRAVRDFLYVEDFIEDLLLVTDRYCVCDPFNMGSGKSIDIRTLVQTILKICKHDVVVRYDDTKPSAIPYRVLDLSKFESISIERKVTPLEKGIEKTVEWYKSINFKDSI